MSITYLDHNATTPVAPEVLEAATACAGRAAYAPAGSEAALLKYRRPGRRGGRAEDPGSWVPAFGG